MPSNPIARQIQQLVGAYFDACMAQDAGAIAACFAPDAVHYLPHLPPLRGGTVIGNAIVHDIRTRGGAYFIDRIVTDVEQYAAAVEWSRTFQRSEMLLRGLEYCAIDSATMLLREIRGYYASPPHANVARHELLGFDYAGRGYRMP